MYIEIEGVTIISDIGLERREQKGFTSTKSGLCLISKNWAHAQHFWNNKTYNKMGMAGKNNTHKDQKQNRNRSIFFLLIRGIELKYKIFTNYSKVETEVYIYHAFFYCSFFSLSKKKYTMSFLFLSFFISTNTMPFHFTIYMCILYVFVYTKKLFWIPCLNFIIFKWP